MTRVRFFAAAAEAAGVDEQQSDAATLGQLRAELAGIPALAALLDRCAVLVDGARVDEGFALVGTETVDVLPPFAGG